MGIIPAAQSPDNADTIGSHPGATFGGLLTPPQVTGSHYREMFLEALSCWSTMGYKSLLYKPVPFVYHTTPRQEDLYVLWQLAAQLFVRTLSACVDLRHRLPITSRRRRGLNKAKKSSCTVKTGIGVLSLLWPLVTAVLRDRHNVQPVHTLSEIEYLATGFPEEIECIGAFAHDEIVGGVVLFHSAAVTHVQYSLASKMGTEIGAMDLLIDHAITAAAERGSRFFDLGISTDASGLHLNEGLHRFKMECGAGTVVYEQYQLGLDPHA